MNFVLVHFVTFQNAFKLVSLWAPFITWLSFPPPIQPPQSLSFCPVRPHVAVVQSRRSSSRTYNSFHVISIFTSREKTKVEKSRERTDSSAGRKFLGRRMKQIWGHIRKGIHPVIHCGWGCIPKMLIGFRLSFSFPVNDVVRVSFPTLISVGVEKQQRRSYRGKISLRTTLWSRPASRIKSFRAEWAMFLIPDHLLHRSKN